jgi:hypothetical protein
MLALQAAPRWFELDVAATPDIIGGWLICLLTLAVYSFLYKDNPFYKLAEHVFVGVATAWYTMEFYDSGVLKAVFVYLSDAFQTLHEPGKHVTEVGGYGMPTALAIAVRFGAVALSVMLLVRLFNRQSWAPRWPLALMIGIYAALKLTAETQARLVSQVKETMVPVAPEGAGWMGIVGNVVFLVGLVCVLGHFVFTFKRGKALAGMSRAGIVILMLTFGGMFGFTVLGRIALLIERVSELASYSEPAYSLTSAAAGAAHGWLDTALTPPFLITALIVLVLVLAKLTGRAQPAPPPA